MPTALPSKNDLTAWDMAAYLDYARDGLRAFPEDPEELLQRRTVLMASPFADLSPVLREAVMLSLQAGDMQTVRQIVGWLEEAGDPAMGYYVHRALADRGDADAAEAFLHSAARHGHLPAQRVLSDRRARSRGALALLYLPLARLAHARKVYRIARANPKDLRLK